MVVAALNVGWLVLDWFVGLGVDPDDDRDVGTVLSDLKADNEDLNDRVDILGVSLARKQQSLWEALQAVDNIAMEDETLHEELEQLRLNGGGDGGTRLFENVKLFIFNHFTPY